MLNEQQTSIVNAFAKATKVSREKATLFAQQLLETAPKTNHGRTTLDSTIHARDVVQKYLNARHEAIPAPLLASQLDLPATTVNNALRFLEVVGKVKRAGTIKVSGGRGRAAVMWQANNT